MGCKAMTNVISFAEASNARDQAAWRKRILADTEYLPPCFEKDVYTALADCDFDAVRELYKVPVYERVLLREVLAAY